MDLTRGSGDTLGSTEVDDVAVILEHVDFLDALDRLHVHLLQRRLQLLVICAGRLVHLFDLAAGSAFASVFGLLVLFSLMRVVDVAGGGSFSGNW